ncbi:hypothetical protein GCM10010317_097520 [Streptomyces mirabilis]|nr:hypothetical protein GCM10010317_097520 [Streptomyces mirabilis]
MRALQVGGTVTASRLSVPLTGVSSTIRHGGGSAVPVDLHNHELRIATALSQLHFAGRDLSPSCKVTPYGVTLQVRAVVAAASSSTPRTSLGAGLNGGGDK